MKRVLISLVLLACFLLPLGGAYTFLMVRREAVRRNVKERLIACIDRSELVQFRFSDKDLRTLKMDTARKEFETDGLMFDIVYCSNKNDTTMLWCWPDHQETNLNMRLDDLAARAFGTDTKNKQVQSDLLQFFALLYYEDVDAPFYHLPSVKLIHTDKQLAIADPAQSADTPPPQSRV
jgi:hypothetical protein